MKRTMALIMVWTAALWAGQTNQVTQSGVTWHFSDSRPVGRFANGDWWVLAPVTITGIDPAFNNGYNGWEVNPIANTNTQGFDKETAYICGFNENLVPALPYTVQNGTVSIIKAISSTAGATRRIAAARVLTVVSQVPPDSGVTVFRPPYIGTAKPFYSVNSINWSFLPSFTPQNAIVTFMPKVTLDSVRIWFANTNLGHCIKERYMRPVDAVPDDYQPANCPQSNGAVLRLMLNDAQAAKQSAMIMVLQRGIDEISWQLKGLVNPESGHQPGLLTIPTFTAALLNITEYKTFLHGLNVIGERGDNFEEFNNIHLRSTLNPDLVLWGSSSTEENYWGYIITGGGARTNQDPYKYIDGGWCAKDQNYQTITINGHKGEILCAYLMPAVSEIWNPTLYRNMTSYVDRMVAKNAWAQPDPCAPAEGVWRGPGPRIDGTRCTTCDPSAMTVKFFHF